MNQIATFEQTFGLTQDDADFLRDVTAEIRKAMKQSTESLLYMGEQLKIVRDEILSGNVSTQGFKEYCQDVLSIDPSHAYKMIKANETYGNIEDARTLGANVLLVLMRDKDPQERLKEALAAQETGTKVTVAKAKEMVAKAKEIVESGETEVFPVYTAAEQQQQIVELQRELEAASPELSTSGASPQRDSLCRTKKIARAKRLLNTLIDLLAVELTNADLTSRDLEDAVAEMLLSSDAAESESISQLREFCSVVCNPII